ncbi:MAG: RNA 2'-phosphotransferase [Planctomycetes bacterium]|nr:RNA 2'-phosphotransferase [Planctomycetota bacterium]
MDDRHREHLSRFLSLVLRHRPDLIGLELGPGGFVPVDALLTGCAARGNPLTRAELAELVARCPKQRFAFGAGGATIRASQGHSVAIDLAYEPAEPPAALFHGTAAVRVAAILREGLRRMRRHHVHLSADVATARAVGRRRGPPVVLVVDAAAMVRAGHAFYRSANGVWLTERVPPGFLQVIEPEPR